MTCPNCQELLTEQFFTHQRALHCANCGGTYFEENGINRISLSQAQQLAFNKRGNFIFEHEKICPKDKLAMLPVQEESIPPRVHLYQCVACKGIFTYPDDLLLFKQAQAAKLTYFKLWDMPLPSLKSVVVAGVVASLSLFLFGAFYVTRQQYLPTTQAQDLVKNVHTTASGRYLFMTFRTEGSYVTAITFVDRTDNKKYEKVVSAVPKSLHYFTTTDLNLGHTIFYQIQLRDAAGKEVVTAEQRLVIEK